MRKATLFTAAGLVAVVALSGSAFTAASTIDDADIHVGSVAQSISGATITSVVHTYTAASDTTTALDAKAAQVLSKTVGVVTVVTGNGTDATINTDNCTVTWLTALEAPTTVEGDAVSSALACDITDTVNLNSVRFVING